MGKELEQAAAENQNEKKKKRLRLTVAALCVAGAAAVGAGVSAVYTTGYSVEYQGSTIAYVANKDALASAVVRAEALTSDLLDTDYSFGQDLQIKSALVPRDSVAPLTEATIRLTVNNVEAHTASMGDGPVNAMDLALMGVSAYVELEGDVLRLQKRQSGNIIDIRGSLDGDKTSVLARLTRG